MSPLSFLIRRTLLGFALGAMILAGAGCIVISYSDKRTSTSSSAKLEQQEFGRMPDGTPVQVYTLINPRGMKVKISSYGATLTDLSVPDRHGRNANIILSRDKLEDYLNGFPAAASVIGRVANRIAKARFTLDGHEYHVTANEGENHIHGGRRGFAKVVWEAKTLECSPQQISVLFTYRSRDGEEGYPGNLVANVTYTLTDQNELRIDYRATSDKPTPVNLTNHAYFNLAGSGDVLAQVLTIKADQYTVADDKLIPTGEIAPVAGTPLDFNKPTAIDARIDAFRPKLTGYDHNYVLRKKGQAMALAARLEDPASGRILEVRTTQPGLQLYTANHLTPPHTGVCFETQHYPDSVNHPDFPSTILRPGETFRSSTSFRFLSR
jgi:aldose 1-epimerase